MLRLKNKTLYRQGNGRTQFVALSRRWADSSTVRGGRVVLRHQHDEDRVRGSGLYRTIWDGISNTGVAQISQPFRIPQILAVNPRISSFKLTRPKDFNKHADLSHYRFCNITYAVSWSSVVPRYRLVHLFVLTL